MSRPNRSTQPSSIVQSLCASVPSAWKSRNKLASIQPGLIFVSHIQWHTFDRHGLRDRLPLKLGVATLRLRMQQVTVRVPASTSNLGPGFDCLGVALRIYNSVTVTRGRWPEQPHPQIVSDRPPDDFSNRPVAVCFRFSFSIVEEIPRSRGLGSSATIRLGILDGA